MKIVHSEFSKNLISNFIPDFLLKKNPVIAGGFALSLYMTTLAAKDPCVAAIMSSSLKDPSRMVQLLVKFSDIDIWFLEGNEVLNDKDFMEVFFGDKVFAQGVMTIKESDRSSFTVKDGSYSGLRLEKVKSSFWANTIKFIDSNPKLYAFPTQIIKRFPKDIESLVKNFDLKTSSIAWVDGSFYISDGFEESILRKNIELNEGQLKRLKRQKFGTKIFQSLRTFKYGERFNFEFSKEVFDLMVENIFLASDYLLRLQEERALQLKNNIGSSPPTLASLRAKMGKITVTSSNGNYVEEVVDTNTMEGMCKTLCSKFTLLTKMSHWNDSIALFFANSKEIDIRPILNKKLGTKSPEEKDNLALLSHLIP